MTTSGSIKMNGRDGDSLETASPIVILQEQIDGMLEVILSFPSSGGRTRTHERRAKIKAELLRVGLMVLSATCTVIALSLLTVGVQAHQTGSARIAGGMAWIWVVRALEGLFTIISVESVFLIIQVQTGALLSSMSAASPARERRAILCSFARTVGHASAMINFLSCLKAFSTLSDSNDETSRRAVLGYQDMLCGGSGLDPYGVVEFYVTSFCPLLLLFVLYIERGSAIHLSLLFCGGAWAGLRVSGAAAVCASAADGLIVIALSSLFLLIFCGFLWYLLITSVAGGALSQRSGADHLSEKISHIRGLRRTAEGLRKQCPEQLSLSAQDETREDRVYLAADAVMPARRLREGLQKGLGVSERSRSQAGCSEQGSGLAESAVETEDASTQSRVLEDAESGLEEGRGLAEVKRLHDEMQRMEEQAKQREERATRMEEDIKRVVAEVLQRTCVEQREQKRAQNAHGTERATHRGSWPLKTVCAKAVRIGQLCLEGEKATSGGHENECEVVFSPHSEAAPRDAEGPEGQKNGHPDRGGLDQHPRQHPGVLLGLSQGRHALNIDLLSEMAIKDDAGLGTSVSILPTRHNLASGTAPTEGCNTECTTVEGVGHEIFSSHHSPASESMRNCNADALVDQSARTTPLNVQSDVVQAEPPTHMGAGKRNWITNGWICPTSDDIAEGLRASQTQAGDVTSSLPSASQLEDCALQSWTPATGSSGQQTTPQTSTDSLQPAQQLGIGPRLVNVAEGNRELLQREEVDGDVDSADVKHGLPVAKTADDSCEKRFDTDASNGNGGWLVQAEREIAFAGSQGGAEREVLMDVKKVLQLPSISSDKRDDLGLEWVGSMAEDEDPTSSPSEWGESIRAVKGRRWIVAEDKEEEVLVREESCQSGDGENGGQEAQDTSAISPLSCSTVFSTSVQSPLRHTGAVLPSQHAPSVPFEAGTASSRALDKRTEPAGRFATDPAKRPAEEERISTRQEERGQDPECVISAYLQPKLAVPKLDLSQLSQRHFADEDRAASMAPRAVEPTDAVRPPKRSLSPRSGQHNSSLLSAFSVSPLPSSIQDISPVGISDAGMRGDGVKRDEPAIRSAGCEQTREGTSDSVRETSQAEHTNLVGARSTMEAVNTRKEANAGNKLGAIVPKSSLHERPTGDGNASASAKVWEEQKSEQQTQMAGERQAEAYRAAEDRKEGAASRKLNASRIPPSPSSSDRGCGLWSGSEFGQEMEDTCESNSDSDHDGIVFSTRPGHQQLPQRGPRFPRSYPPPTDAAAPADLSTHGATSDSLPRPNPFRAFPPLPPPLHQASPHHATTPSSQRRPSSRARRGLFSMGAVPSPIPQHPHSQASPASYQPSSPAWAEGFETGLSSPQQPTASLPTHAGRPLHLPLVGPGVPSIPTPRAASRRADGSELSQALSARPESVSPYAALDSLKQLAQQSVQTYRAAAMRAYRAISPRVDGDDTPPLSGPGPATLLAPRTGSDGDRERRAWSLETAVGEASQPTMTPRGNDDGSITLDQRNGNAAQRIRTHPVAAGGTSGLHVQQGEKVTVAADLEPSGQGGDQESDSASQSAGHWQVERKGAVAADFKLTPVWTTHESVLPRQAEGSKMEGHGCGCPDEAGRDCNATQVTSTAPAERIENEGQAKV